MLKKTALVVLLLIITAGSVGCGSLATPNRLLSLDTVVNIFAREGVNLITDYSKSPDDFEFRGTTPAIFRIGRTQDNLLVYIFDSFLDETEDYNQFGIERVPFVSRNVLVVYLPSIIRDQNNFPLNDLEPIIKTMRLISNVVFKYLNNGKKIIYKGESKHWKARVRLTYYQNWWDDENGNRHYQCYNTESHDIRYKVADIKDLRNISYEFKANRHSGGAAGIHLEDNAYSDDLYETADSGWLSGDPAKEIYHVTIKWNGKEEKFDLKAQD